MSEERSLKDKMKQLFFSSSDDYCKNINELLESGKNEVVNDHFKRLHENLKDIPTNAVILIGTGRAINQIYPKFLDDLSKTNTKVFLFEPLLSIKDEFDIPINLLNSNGFHEDMSETDDIVFVRNNMKYYIYPFGYPDIYTINEILKEYINKILNNGGHVFFCYFGSYVFDFDIFYNIFVSNIENKRFIYLHGSPGRNTILYRVLEKIDPEAHLISSYLDNKICKFDLSLGINQNIK